MHHLTSPPFSQANEAAAKADAAKRPKLEKEELEGLLFKLFERLSAWTFKVGRGELYGRGCRGGRRWGRGQACCRAQVPHDDGQVLDGGGLPA